jgi:transposase
MSNSNISKRLAQVQPGTLHVGVDLGLEENTVVVIDERARKLIRFQFPQTADGHRYFLNKLEALQAKLFAPEVVVAMEPTNYFWKLLANTLESEKKWTYHLVNSYTVKKHREGNQLDRSKDDLRDSFTIADLSRTGKYTETRLQHGVYEELRQFATLYYQLSKSIRSKKNILHGLVGQVFPELSQVFKDFNGLTAKALLSTCPAAASIRLLTEEDFIAQVRSAFLGKKLLVSKLKQAYCLSHTSIGLMEGIQANHLAIQVHFNHLELLQKERVRVIVALRGCLQEIEVSTYLLSMRGFGALSAALFLAEIGNPSYYRKADQLVKMAGIQPVPNTSGRKQRSRTPMSHLGRAKLRTLLYFACLRLIRFDRGFKTRYLELQQRDHNPLTKMQALGVLMNKLLRILWALMKNKTSYNTDWSSTI